LNSNLSVTNLGNVIDNYWIDLEFNNSLAENISQIYLSTNYITIEPGNAEDITINLTIPLISHLEDLIFEITFIVISDSEPSANITNSAQFKISATPISMIPFIIREISNIRDEINQTLDSYMKYCIIKHLDFAEIELEYAIWTYINNFTTVSIILEKLSKIHLEISSILTKIGDFLDVINETCADYLISSFHRIRDHITLTMGVTAGTIIALEIAKIEIEIMQLADEVYDSVCIIKALMIDLNLWQASNDLDLSLIYFSMGRNTSTINKLEKSIRNLEQTIETISFLQLLQWISEEYAQFLNTRINTLISSLEVLTDNLLENELH